MIQEIAWLRTECPACRQPIEVASDTAARGIECPSCGTGFVPGSKPPSKFKRFLREFDKRIIAPEQPSKPIPVKSEADRIAGTANAVSFFAKLCFAGVGLCLILIAYAGADPNSGLSVGAILWFAASLLTFGLVLLFLSQLIHIRALLERLSEK